MIEMTKTQARRYLLAYHRLLSKKPIASVRRVVDYIRRVACIQFDPLSIVARNADLVLQSRLNRYLPDMLDRALYVDRTLIDGFDKVASIMAIEDWPYFRRLREGQRRWIDTHHPELYDVFAAVLSRIEELGSAGWTDVRFDKTIDWPWGKAEIGRAALQALFHIGELVIHHRVGTRKYYASAKRHIPRELLGTPEPNPAVDSYVDWRVARRIRSVGLLPNRGSEAWQIDGVKSAERTASIDRLMQTGEIAAVRVKGIKPTMYAPAASNTDIEKRRRLPAGPVARCIAPLDNVLWDRRLVEELFGFSYRWEVYTPAKKRKYGYYVLPVLYGDRFVARCEPVMNRKTRRLEIVGWWWENDASPAIRDWKRSDLSPALLRCFSDFMRFCGAESVLKTTDAIGLEWVEELASR